MGFLGLSDADQAFPRLGKPLQQLPDILGRVFITKTDAQGGVQFLRRQASAVSTGLFLPREQAEPLET